MFRISRDTICTLRRRLVAEYFLFFFFLSELYHVKIQESSEMISALFGPRPAVKDGALYVKPNCTPATHFRKTLFAPGET